MRHFLLAVAVGTLAGCATSAQIEKEARLHDMRADAASTIRDYDVAAAEKHEAQRLHQKALKRAYKEGNSGVVIPSEPQTVPHQ
jgi:hypothetical protein